MTEEVKVTNKEKNECKCFCRSEGFRNFLIVALGSFVGVFSALSLFAALHKPPMMPPCAGMGRFNPPPVVMQCPFKQRHHFNKGQFHGQKQFGDRVQKGHPQPFDSEKADD